MEDKVKVLFPVDLSGISAKIVPEVVGMAEKLKAEIHLLLVIESLESYDTFFVPHPTLDNFEGELMRSAMRKLEDFERDHLEDYPTKKRVVLRGDPAKTILSYIDKEKVDFVVVGTYGRQGLEKLIFGSVAEQVIKNSPVPVLTVNPYRKTEAGEIPGRGLDEAQWRRWHTAGDQGQARH